MSLENILEGDMMGIFNRLHRGKGGIAAAAVFAAAMSASPSYANENSASAPIQMTPQIQQQIDNQKIPLFLADTMFQRIPDARRIIMTLNSGVGMGDRNGILRPNMSIPYVPGRTINLTPITDDELRLPETWVLYRAVFNDAGMRNMTRYALEKNLIHGTPGLYEFIQGLTGNRENRMRYLNKALYIATTGSANGAEPLINGSYIRNLEVQDRVRDWKENHNFAPFSNENNHLYAYLTMTIPNTEIKDPYLAGLALYFLEEINIGQELRNVYSRLNYNKSSIHSFTVMNNGRTFTHISSKR